MKNLVLLLVLCFGLVSCEAPLRHGEMILRDRDGNVVWRGFPLSYQTHSQHGVKKKPTVSKPKGSSRQVLKASKVTVPKKQVGSHWYTPEPPSKLKMHGFKSKVPVYPRGTIGPYLPCIICGKRFYSGHHYHYNEKTKEGGWVGVGPGP